MTGHFYCGSTEAGLKRLEHLLASFYAAHGEELSEIALASAVRSPDRAPDAKALARLLETGLTADPAD